MSIDTNICNDALNFLGAEPLASLNANNKRARICKQQYPIARDFVLRNHPWNFALKRDLITPTGNSLAFGETNEFLLPADCVRINKVMGGNWKQVRYKTEGRAIYALAEEINLSYVSNTVPVGFYDASFKRAVAAQLAGDICYQITQSTSLMQGLYNMAKEVARDSRTVDSMENTPENFNFDYFDNARISGHEIYPDPNFM